MTARILIAEDEESIVASLELRAHLVLLDIMLPGRSGFDVCRAIRGDPEAAGTHDYMTKPFATRDLVARVHALLGAAGAR